MRKLSFILICIVLAISSQARIITVDDDGPADFSTIQAAINDANNGDSIIVLPGIYLEEYINFLGKNITLTSTDPTDWDIVRATTIGDPVWGCSFVVFRGSEDPNCKLTGFNIEGGIVGYDYRYGKNHTHATISYCLLQDIITPCDPAIYAFDGTISNCVISSLWNVCLSSKHPAIYACNGLIKNCTITQIDHAPIIVSGGTCIVENCIIYNNLWGISVGIGATLNISYCNIQGGRGGISGGGTVNWGPGNIDAEPVFDSYGHFDSHNRWITGDYHLKSQAGRWNVTEGRWTTDEVTSLCIDAGNPASPIGYEPFPNGGIINMGAYGGTSEASKSYFGEPVCETIVVGDINGDCIVDFKDFAIIAGHWLEEH